MIQTEIYNDKSFQCEMHPEQSMKLICYSEKCPYKRRFVCLKCLLEQKKEQDNIATLQDFIKDPLSILDKTNEQQYLKRNNCEALLEQIDEFKIMLQKKQQDILLQLDNLEVQVSSVIKNLYQAQDQVLKRLKIHEFQQQLNIVWKMDSFQGTQEFAVLEQQLNTIVLSWKDCCQQIANQQAKLSQDIQQQLSVKMDNKLKQEKNLYEKLVKSLSGIFDSKPQIPILIHQEIKKGKLIIGKMQLTISFINNYFIKECPCQLFLKDTGYYVVDDTNQSFIFQQNKQEIYRLKDKQQAIYCNKDYGPTFGSDFQVYNAFKQLSSILGCNYDITGYNVQNRNYDLIGCEPLQIVECKVFKITFQ